MAPLKVSAIISTKNRLPQLKRCLPTLAAQTRLPDELVVIDAGSDPQVEALVRGQRFAKVGYHAYPSSLTQARNHGVRNSTGDIVLFLDDDLILEPDFIAEMAAVFERDAERKIAGATGDILNHHRRGELHKQLFKVLFQLPYDGDGRFRLSGAPTMVHGLQEERLVEFVPGGLTAWRREVFREFAFDENLPGLGVNEDVDFSYRVSRRWRNAYTPKAKVRHDRPDLSREGKLAYLKLELSSYWYLYKKNQPKDPLHFAAFLWHDVGVIVRFFFRRFLRSS